MTEDGRIEREGPGATAHARRDKRAQPRSKGVTGNTEADVASIPSDTRSPGDAFAAGREGPPVVEAVRAAVTSAPDGSAEGSRPLYFLTNRMNLNGVLSSRIIAPRASFRKYYSDLLEDVPGWVPLLTTPPSRRFLERVTVERGAGGPVILELRMSAGEPCPQITYVRAALLSDVTAIHFPDQRSVREHRARTYGNVHAHDELLRVTPDLFDSGLPDVAVAVPSGVAPEVDWRRLDRVRGALNGLLAASDTGESLAIAARAFGASDVPEDAPAPPWLRWAELTGNSVDAAHESADQSADRLIFAASYDVLAECDQTVSWSPLEVLESVASRVVATEPAREVMGVVDRHLGRVRELVSAKSDFEPFRNPGSPHVAAKSLLLVLLRPDLEQLLAWSPEDTGADEVTMLVAALFAGRLRGLARESVALRRPLLDDLTAAWVVRLVEERVESFGQVHFAVDDNRTALLVDGNPVAEAAPFVGDPIAGYRSLDVQRREEARVAVSRELGWPVETLIRVPPDADVSLSDEGIRILAVGDVRTESRVDEAGFLARLRLVRGAGRRRAADLIAGVRSDGTH